MYVSWRRLFPSYFHLFINQEFSWLLGLVVTRWSRSLSINVVALRRARLVLGWVTVRINQSHPGLLSLAIHPWVGTMSTGLGLGHR